MRGGIKIPDQMLIEEHWQEEGLMPQEIKKETSSRSFRIFDITEDEEGIRRDSMF